MLHVEPAAALHGQLPVSDCPADIDTNGAVDRDDLELVLLLWNHFGTDADVNNDMIVDVFDLLDVLAAWGPCPQR